MTVIEAARALRTTLSAPAWALSVTPWTENGKEKLIVRVDPNYRQAIDAPKYFEGFPVEIQWKTIFRAL